MPDAERHVLPGGLTVLLDPDADAQTVAAGYFVRTGARDELPAEMGVSHFIEHLLFKGSDTLSAAELNARLDDLGGHANAFTSEEATVYHAASLPERTAELLGTLTELMRPALRAADIEPERGVILEEIAMYADQPSVRVAEELHADYWGAHPLGHRILGTPQTVGHLSPDALRRNHRDRYGAGRVTLAVSGNFDAPAVLAWARGALGTWHESPGAPDVPPARPAHPGSLRVITEHALSRVQVATAAPGLGILHPLREAAAVLADLIGGDNGALYWALIDTGLADGADLSHLDYVDAGIFEGGFSCDPARAQTVLDTYRAVLRGAADLITPDAVRRAARKHAVGLLLRADTPQDRLFTLGMEYLATGRVVSVPELVARFERLTVQDVRDVLALCPLDELTVVALGPLDHLT
ncbi:putative Zn-dependent peptidase [Deinococcus metalli]|uniref:Putative Zn-dependent peptidase n=1 Tax=Deinococcus metalli TaxID=1141878 RepID=A0A7W8KFY0_9DEIO|nr:pitrilysin family protein [Deinococcus metalli]MBB5377469.1 putative Zn-dependent peptidase [Deinococcus metalli]GHF50662.1 zinc protease [Deinococcus metalli]